VSKKLVLSAFLCTFVLQGVFAQEQVQIKSVGTNDGRIPIAVPSFPAESSVAQYGPVLAQVLARDLDFTGLVRIVQSIEYPTTFRGFPVDPSKINFNEWKKTPAENLVFGFLRQSPNGDVIAECRLFDVVVAQQILGRKLSTPNQWYRLLAHQFADESIRHLTGVPGVASSELVFSGKSGRAKEIYISDYDGAMLKQITHHNSISIKPKFSPDGTKIAYMSYKDRYPFIYIYDRNSGKSVPFSTHVGLNSAPTWAPNGNTLALCLSKDGNTEIYSKNIDGSNVRRLTRDRGSDTSPVFSPDGRKIAFVSDRSGRPQIYTMNVDGSGVTRLSYQGGSSYDPAWSPDGRMLAYVVEKNGEGFELYVMNQDGSGARAYTSSRGYNESPSWAPDSRHVIFASSRQGRKQLHTVTLETGVVKQVEGISHLDCEGPSWGPRRY
jgi:TolB protein